MIPDLSVLWVIAFLLLLSILLDRLLLRPVIRVMGERQGAIRAARDLAEASRAKAQMAGDEFDGKTRAARAEVYRQMEEKRRGALAGRMELVTDTRQEVERSVADAAVRIRTQAEAARGQLDRDADALAATIVERILGRTAS